MSKTINQAIFNKLENFLGNNRVKKNIVLAPHTSFKIGGQAEYYFEALTKEDLINACLVSTVCRLKLTILGGGSNVIISDKGCAGLVIKNLYKEKTIVSDQNNVVELKISSGYPISALAYETADDGLAGLECHFGLPGTVGGAVYMNSKWTDPLVYMGDSLIEAELVDLKGKVKTVSHDYFQFAYDFSILQKTKEILLSAIFKLKKENKEEIKKRADAILVYRKKTQPFGIYSAGCFFKNINGQSIGELIDKLGLKGFSVGNFSISDKHGNFIIHKGNGATKDLDKLLYIIKSKAKEKYGIKLEEEVIFIS